MLCLTFTVVIKSGINENLENVRMLSVIYLIFYPWLNTLELKKMVHPKMHYLRAALFQTMKAYSDQGLSSFKKNRQCIRKVVYYTYALHFTSLWSHLIILLLKVFLKFLLHIQTWDIMTQYVMFDYATLHWFTSVL